VQPEHRENGTRFCARYRHRRAALSGLQRSQNPQLHRLKGSHSTIVGGSIQHPVKIE